MPRRTLVPILMATALTVAVTAAPAAAPVPADAPPPGAGHSADAQPPPADASLPTTAAGVTRALSATTRELRAQIVRWRDTGDPRSGRPPRAVTLFALHHQRLHRLIVRWPAARADAVIAALPEDVRGEARDTLAARRAIAAIPRHGRPPAVRTASADPAGVLRRHYERAEERFRVPWTILAAVNFVESAFGRVRSASEAGARGPMQFLPATWRAYGLGGDIDDAGDAILGAANYLRRSGAPGDLDRALFAYNHSRDYVRAIRRFASRMRRDDRAFYAYYAWQVYARTATGVRRLTGPGL